MWSIDRNRTNFRQHPDQTQHIIISSISRSTQIQQNPSFLNNNLNPPEIICLISADFIRTVLLLQ